jgi:hypothetical protein
MAGEPASESNLEESNDAQASQLPSSKWDGGAAAPGMAVRLLPYRDRNQRIGQTRDCTLDGVLRWRYVTLMDSDGPLAEGRWAGPVKPEALRAVPP